MVKVFIDYSGYEFIRAMLKKPPETCGNMSVDFVAGSYYLSDFREEYFSKSHGSCTPVSSLGGGVWHTHPENMSKASGRDIETMKRDLASVINTDVPGVPPLNLIASLSNGNPVLTAYIPTFELEVYEKRAYHLWNTSPLKFSAPPWIKKHDEKKFEYHFLLLNVEEKLDGLTGKTYYEIQETLPVRKSEVKNADGIFIGSKVPAHVIPLLIVYFAEHSGKKNFLVFRENEGMVNISLSDYKEKIIEREVKISSPEFGYEERLKQISGINLQKAREWRIALFGAGFLGTQIAGALSKYFGEIVIVDDDFVGYENVGYQEYYTPDDAGVEKAYALARKLENIHPQVKIYGIRAEVPNFDAGLPKIIEEIVRWANCVVTAFDTIHPRLTLQVACSKYSKPLVDAGAGIHDGTVRIWLPETKYHCIGCYTYFNPKPIGRNVYASDPAVARLISSIIARICIKLAEKREVPNVVDINLEELSITSNNWEKNDECSFCSKKVKFVIDLGGYAKLITECDREMTVYEFERNLMSLLGKDIRINYISKTTSSAISVPKNSNLILLKILERQELEIHVSLN